MDDKYIVDLIIRYNNNQSDPSISAFELVLLNKIRESEKRVSNAIDKIKTLNNEIQTRNQEMSNLNNDIIKERGRNEAMFEIIKEMALKNE